MRFDVVIELHQKHSLAVEATDQGDANTKALAALGTRDPEQQTITIVSEVGVR